MRISVSVDDKMLQAFLKVFPHATQKSINIFKDTVGYKMSADAARSAPAITGHLRRSIYYYRNTASGDARVYALANYAKYVHGSPYYNFKSLVTRRGKARKITPFFTMAQEKNRGFIDKEAKKIMRRVLK